MMRFLEVKRIFIIVSNSLDFMTGRVSERKGVRERENRVYNVQYRVTIRIGIGVEAS